MRKISFSVLVDHGISLLSSRPHSKFELAQKLSRLCKRQQARSAIRISRFEKKKGFEPKSAELSNTRSQAESAYLDCSAAVPLSLEELEDQGYIDDHQYALWHIRQRQKWKPRSTQELKSELLTKGVQLNTIKSSLEEAQYNEEEACRTLVEQKVARGTSQIVTKLMRRGFRREMLLAKLKEIEVEERRKHKTLEEEEE
jgi:SOS response regulatory protein OraA/RecX